MLAHEHGLKEKGGETCATGEERKAGCYSKKNAREGTGKKITSPY